MREQSYWGNVLRGVVGVECVISGISQFFRNSATKKNRVHLVVDGIRLVPCEIWRSVPGDAEYTKLCSLIESQQDQCLGRVEFEVVEQGDEPPL